MKNVNKLFRLGSHGGRTVLYFYIATIASLYTT